MLVSDILPYLGKTVKRNGDSRRYLCFMDNISHFIITYDTSYKNIKAIIWRICSAPNFAIYCYHVVMHHTTTPQPQFLTIPRSPIDPVQCWRGFVEQQGKMFSRNFVDRKQNIGLILDCQRNHSTTRNRSSGLNFFNKIEQCSAKAAAINNIYT